MVFNLLARPATTSNEELKRKQFSSVIKGADGRKFGELFNSFIGENKFLLNSELAHHIAVNSKGEKRLDHIEQFISNEVKELGKDDPIDQTNFIHFFELITAYGVTHPQLFRRIRRYLMRFSALGENPGLKKIAEASLDSLTSGFREWLGVNRKIAVDLETGEEYQWEDVITFDEGINPEDRQRIKNAILKTSVLREAVFLFSNGFLIRLDDILPGGIWISKLESDRRITVSKVAAPTLAAVR